MRFQLWSLTLIAGLCAIPLHSNADTDSAASIPLIRSASVSQLDFEAYAHANGRKTYSEFLDQPSASSSENLSRLMERAQEAWVDSSVMVAQNLFQEVANLALENDWRDSEREAIHYSFLRLAQMTEPGPVQDRWLAKATSFDWTRKADPSLFPPPLLERLRSVHEAMAKQARSVRFDQIFPEARVVRINGRRLDPSDRNTQLPEGQYRVSVYSDALPAVTETLQLNELLSYNRRLKPLATGSCSNPLGGENALGRWTAVDVFYGPKCLARRDTSGWTKPDSNRVLNPTLLPDGTNGHPLNWPVIPNENEIRPSLHRRTWLWVGVSALALGAAYALYRNQQREPASSTPTVEPVHRQGF